MTTPFDLPWPRATARTVLRPLTMGDVDAMLVYRSLPEVCRYLNHDVLDRVAVEERISSRMPENQSGGDITCGLAVVMDGQMVGDAMLRVITRAREAWIGFGLHPSVWGRGLASEIASELVRLGSSLGMSVWADVFEENIPSQKALMRAGLAAQGAHEGRKLFTNADPTTADRADTGAEESQ